MKKNLKKSGIFLLLSLPIFIFVSSFTTNIDRTLFGDWDYFAQLYEAARRSILEFKQFPWFNPWVGGGVPLYANPQFGLFSVPMFLVLIFGTLTGLHLTLLVYLLVGFWGMKKLLIHLGANSIVGILLSYIWVFSSFPSWHLSGGHLTFSTYLLAPWFFYFLININKKLGWLWFGLFAALVMNQSLHYMAVHMLVIGSLIVGYQIWKYVYVSHRSLSQALKPYLLSSLVLIPLIAHKLYFTLQYLHDFPRIPPIESGTPINMITASLTFRGSEVIDPIANKLGNFGWAEYAAYFGLLTLGLFAYLVIRDLDNLKKLKRYNQLLLLGILMALLLSIGNFSLFSPYGLLKKLPVFEEMQVAPRWLGWFVFGIILYLARLPRKTTVVALLAISVVDVFTSNYGVINYNAGKYTPPLTKHSVLRQEAFVANGQPGSQGTNRFLYATQSNIGDIFGYEPIVGFGGDINEGYQTLTNRCASNRSECNFVTSNNASVVYWSPNRIELKRTGSGDIKINENPGAYWLVNGKRLFKDKRVLELKQDFAISDLSENITLKIDPSFLYQ